VFRGRWDVTLDAQRVVLVRRLPPPPLAGIGRFVADRNLVNSVQRIVQPIGNARREGGRLPVADLESVLLRQVAYFRRGNAINHVSHQGRIQSRHV